MSLVAGPMPFLSTGGYSVGCVITSWLVLKAGELTLMRLGMCSAAVALVAVSATLGCSEKGIPCRLQHPLAAGLGCCAGFGLCLGPLISTVPSLLNKLTQATGQSRSSQHAGDCDGEGRGGGASSRAVPPGRVFAVYNMAFTAGYMTGPAAGTALVRHAGFFWAGTSFASVLLLAAPVLLGWRAPRRAEMGQRQRQMGAVVD